MSPTETITTLAADEELRHALRASGRRLTSQRVLIHRVLRELDRHATAEEVHEAVSERLPGVSLPTVYATLDVLQELKLVRRVNVGGGAVLYDARGDEHHHLACRRCGRVEDLDAQVDLRSAVSAARRHGFAAERADVVVSGLCRRCSSRKR
jgi:Fe2+ or Zn2+ uptake regulation protein